MRWTNFIRVEATRKQEANSRFLPTIAAILLGISTAAAANVPSSSATVSVAGKTKSSSELLISIPDRKLAFLEDGKVVKVYSIAVGAPGTPSPAGHFKIINRLVRPTYYHQGLVIRPGRGNPLGNRWMGLDLKGFGIHGTNEPRSIGLAASHGCIRMGKKDVEDLFRRVRVGDEVTIYRERPAQLAAVFEPHSESDTHTKVAAEVEQQSSTLRAEVAGSF